MPGNEPELKDTVLKSRHLKAGAKLVPFAGYRMPVSFDSIIAEHLTVRSSVGVFDLFHMGHIYVSGDRSLDFLSRMLTNDPRRLDVGQAQYTLMLNDSGGVIDDLLLYRLPESYFMVVNASRRLNDYAWLAEHCIDGVELDDRSDRSGIIAVQGPETRKLMARIGVGDTDDLFYMEHRPDSIAGAPVLLACSGYTGEDGFEIIAGAEQLPAVWDAIVSAGGEPPARPAGLGARDTLRTEMCYALYGQDIDERTGPIEADLAWVCRGNDRDFIGKAALDKVKRTGPERTLIAFRTEGPVPPRPGFDILIDGRPVGVVTSGTYSPSLKCGMGMGFVPTARGGPGGRVAIAGRGRELEAEIETKPLYRGGSIRRRPKNQRRTP